MRRPGAGDGTPHTTPQGKNGDENRAGPGPGGRRGLGDRSRDTAIKRHANAGAKEGPNPKRVLRHAAPAHTHTTHGKTCNACVLTFTAFALGFLYLACPRRQCEVDAALYGHRIPRATRGFVLDRAETGFSTKRHWL